eukprot:scaffold2083_cov419-Prasinococcus_capsulatus_cf.AAC.8
MHHTGNILLTVARPRRGAAASRGRAMLRQGASRGHAASRKAAPQCRRSPATMRLTPAEVSAIAGGKDVRTLTRLDAQNKGITQVLDLDACNSLKGVNLSKNKLTSATFLAEMKQLVWLNVSENNLTTLDGVQELSKVKVTPRHMLGK